MYKIPANTLFMGKNLVFVPECPSTNTLALQISQQSPVKEGTLVITDHQTAGKGQLGNIWEAEPGNNLTFSLILKPGFLAVNRQFFLNIVVCLALKDYLMKKTSDIIYIKWPNDILVHQKKISGILIENQLQGSAIQNAVVGIGFNLNQKRFDAPLAISLAQVTGKTYDREKELPLIIEHIEGRYLQLRQGDYGALMAQYLDSLYRRREKHTFASNGGEFEGEIEDLDRLGRLRIWTKEGVRVFGAREVRYL